MTLVELGSLGEFLGGIAVVISLIYVGLQIRQNTTAVEHASARAVIDDANGWRALLIEHHEIAELYRKGMIEPDSLDPVERLRFRMLLDALFDTWSYGQYSKESLINEEHVRVTLSQPGGVRYWMNEKGRFDSEFQQYVDGIGATIDSQE